jgi:lipopolysaccharide/colanic/teichoic acid biosynthesis glycosyltransferase
LPEEVARYSERQRRVLNIKPGITGLAQISGRDHLNFDEEVRLDAFYIENWSLGSDLVILVKTLVVVFQHKPAV